MLRPVSLSGFFFYSPSEIYFKGFQRLLQTSSLSRHVKILTRAGKNPLTSDRSAIYSVRKETPRRHGLQTVHLTREAMYVWRNIEARSRNHCCSGKAISITYCVCLLPYLSSIQSACALLCRQLWPVPLYHIFPHYLINGTIFGGKKKLMNVKCVSTFSTTFVRKISHSQKNSTRYRVRQK